MAARGHGKVAPNPSVGCVLVDDTGGMCAIARTSDGGRPHAEWNALSQVSAQGLTAYVTLEPCAHEGQTPSCARLLAEAGIKRVVVGWLDPDPRTAGQGIQFLTQAGVEVELLHSRAAASSLAGYLLRVQEKRPFVTVKIAVSRDGFMTTGAGNPPAITGAEVKAKVHLMRSEHDALVTGIGTVLADNPRLTCRLDKMTSPPSFVVDSSAKFPAGCALDRPETVIFTRQIKASSALTAQVKPLENLEVPTILKELSSRGVNRVMVEAGPRLTKSFLQSELVDALVVFKAPHNLRTQPVPDLDFIGVEQAQAKMVHFRRGYFGVDQMDIWQREGQPCLQAS